MKKTVVLINSNFWKYLSYVDTEKDEIKEGGRIYEKILHIDNLRS